MLLFRLLKLDPKVNDINNVQLSLGDFSYFIKIYIPPYKRSIKEGFLRMQ